MSPVLLDIAGDGLRLTSLEGGVTAATRPGYQRTQRAWTEPWSDDAWLVLDRNGDGVINDFSEMFGSATPQGTPADGKPRNGFLALAEFDDNSDGKIDASDPIFTSLRLWQDRNHDGVSQPEELHTLTELGVAGLSVAYSEARQGDEHGNLYRYKSSVYGTPVSTVGPEAWDIWLVGVQSIPIAAAGNDATRPATLNDVASGSAAEGAGDTTDAGACGDGGSGGEPSGRKPPFKKTFKPTVDGKCTGDGTVAGRIVVIPQGRYSKLPGDIWFCCGQDSMTSSQECVDCDPEGTPIEKQHCNNGWPLE